MGNKHFGYWVFGKDMNNVKLETLKKTGVTDIFLNYYAFTTHGKAKVINWMKKAKNNYGINTHIWVQCFYEGAWKNPVDMDLTKKRKEIKTYANTEGVYGVHLDYLRYPGNAYKTAKSTETITNFVKNVRKDNPKTFLSCAVMPETTDDKKYYGQDIDALGKIVDAMIPMQYKGNYSAGTSWLKSTSEYFSKRSKLWSGLQSYKSDDDTTVLSSKELLTDAKTCFSAGATGVVLFRYGLSPSLDLKSYTQKSNTTTTTTTTATTNKSNTVTGSYSYNTIVSKAKEMITSIEKEKKVSGSKWGYYFAKAILTPNKDIKKISFNTAPKATGDKFNNVLIKKADYVKCAKQLVAFVESKKYNRLRNYLDYNKKKIRVRDYVYMLAKVLVFYDKNKRLASYTRINTNVWENQTKTTSTTTTTKTTVNKASLHSYLTNEGCSGMGQCTGYYCGPNSLQQCFYRLTGIRVSESTLASVCGTTTDGTDHPSLNTAVEWFNRKYNKKVTITWKNFSDLGKTSSERWSALQSYINKGAVFCHLLYRDQWGHYEVPKSVGDSYLSILNSLGDSCGSGTYCGYIESRSKSEQLSYINGISQKSIAILTLE